jgi:predicted MFS family arabinose efflux permease
VQFTSWRAVFLVNVPVGLLAAAAAPLLLADSRGRAAARRLDARGAALITLSVAALVFAVSQAGVTGWLAPLNIAALAVCAGSALAFLAAERRHPDPLLPAALLRRPPLRTASALNLLLGLWNGGEMLVLSLYLQQVLRDSPLATGLAIAPQGVIGFTAGAFGARLAARIGIRRVLVLTGITAAAGFGVLTQLPAAGHYSPLLAAVMLVGFGTAGTAFATMVIATTGVAGAEQGVVGGVINTSRQIGAALGAASLPAIAAAAGHSTAAVTAAGTRAAMAAGAVAAALAALVAWRSGRVPAAGPARHSPAPAAAAAIPIAPAASARLRNVGSSTSSTHRRQRPEVHHARPHRTPGLPDRIRHLAARRRLGTHGPVRSALSHPARRRPGRDPVRHRAGLRIRRF